MQARANWPATLCYCLGTVVITVDGPGSQKVGQVRQGLRNIVSRRIKHLLLSSVIGGSRGGQLAGWRVEKCRLIGKQLKRQRCMGTGNQMRAKPGQARPPNRRECK